MNFCPFPFNFILYLSKHIEAFIFLPQVRPTNDGKELDPSLGSIFSKSTLVDIAFIVVSTFFQTPIGSIRPWFASFRYMPDSYNRGLPNCSHVSQVIIFTCDLKSSTTCRTWYPSIFGSTSASASLLSFWFKLQIFFVCSSVFLLCFILYSKSMNCDIVLCFCTNYISSFTVSCWLSSSSSYRASSLNIFVASLYICFSLTRLG